MTKYPVFNIDVGFTKVVWPERRGRPKGVLNADAERKREVIERAVAAVIGEDYMGAAAKFQDEFYGEKSAKDDGSSSNYEKRYNQQKNVAKKIRNCMSS